MTNPATTAAPNTPQPDPSGAVYVGFRDGRHWWAKGTPPPAKPPVATVTAASSEPPRRPQQVSVSFPQTVASNFELDDPTTAAFAVAQRNAGQRFGAKIAAADSDLAAGRWSFGAIVLCVLLTGSSLWGVYVSIWGQPASWSKQPQTQPSLTHDSAGGRNHCRELLIEWIRSGAIGSMTDAEIEAAAQAVREDGR